MPTMNNHITYLLLLIGTILILSHTTTSTLRYFDIAIVPTIVLNLSRIVALSLIALLLRHKPFRTLAFWFFTVSALDHLVLGLLAITIEQAFSNEPLSNSQPQLGLLLSYPFYLLLYGIFFATFLSLVKGYNNRASVKR